MQRLLAHERCRASHDLLGAKKVSKSISSCLTLHGNGVFKSNPVHCSQAESKADEPGFVGLVQIPPFRVLRCGSLHRKGTRSGPESQTGGPPVSTNTSQLAYPCIRVCLITLLASQAATWSGWLGQSGVCSAPPPMPCYHHFPRTLHGRINLVGESQSIGKRRPQWPGLCIPLLPNTAPRGLLRQCPPSASIGQATHEWRMGGRFAACDPSRSPSFLPTPRADASRRLLEPGGRCIAPHVAWAYPFFAHSLGAAVRCAFHRPLAFGAGATMAILGGPKLANQRV